MVFKLHPGNRARFEPDSNALGRTLRVFLFSSYPLRFKISRSDEPNDGKRRGKEVRRDAEGTYRFWLK